MLNTLKLFFLLHVIIILVNSQFISQENLRGLADTYDEKDDVYLTFEQIVTKKS
jgi:hypothetical protein